MSQKRNEKLYVSVYDRSRDREYYDYVSFKLGEHQSNTSPADEQVIKTAVENLRWNLLQEQLSDLIQVARVFAIMNESDQDAGWEYYFYFHSIDVNDFAKALKQWLCCEDPKINTLLFRGHTNSGKTLLVNCITKPYLCCFLSNINKNVSEFVLSPALSSAIVIIEEIFLLPETVNDFKRLMEGAYMTVPNKYTVPQKLSRRPCIATTQHNQIGHGYLPRQDELALRNRCFIFNFKDNFKTVDNTILTAESFWSYITKHW